MSLFSCPCSTVYLGAALDVSLKPVINASVFQTSSQRLSTLHKKCTESVNTSQVSIAPSSAHQIRDVAGSVLGARASLVSESHIGAAPVSISKAWLEPFSA